MRIEDHWGLIGLITGYQGAAVVTAAWNLGVFAAVGEEPQGADRLALRLGVDVRSLEALLETLVELGLLRRDGGGFAATAFGAMHLGRGAELGLVIEKEAVFARAWQDLERVVRTGVPALAPWEERLRTEPERARSFLSALDVLARLTGPDLCSVPSLAPGRSVVDVGGGLGSYARALVEAGSRVVLVDLPRVADWAREALADLPQDSCRVVAADVVVEGLPADIAVDAALVSHLLHDLSPRACLRVLRAVHDALAPGGAVVVNDFARDAGPGPFGPLFDVMMRVETGGSAYPIHALMDFLREARFEQIRRLDFPPPLTVVEARREG